MRKILVIIVCVVAGLASWSCIEDDFTTNSNDVLAFSADTVSFDTVFTGENTSTRRFLVYNRHKKQLNIERIFLSDVPEGVSFFLNVDGRSGDEFQNVEVRGEDSIYVFAEACVDTTVDNLPFDVFGHLNFVTNGTLQTVVLHAAGQNVHTVSDWHIVADTTLSTDRPYRVMDSIVVEAGATLTVPAGVTLYFHDKARIRVRGRLLALGEQGMPVMFRADRLDQVTGDIPFDLMAGQWDGISIDAQSFDNEFRYVDMHGSDSGLRIDSCGVLERRKLYLYNTVLHNAATSTLSVRHAWVDATGCEFSDSKDGVVDLVGGVYAFNNCTFANYYLFDAITSPILTLGYLLPEEQVGGIPLMRADFNNCIIYGNTSDISAGDLSGSSVRLQYCLLRSSGEDDDHFLHCVWGGDPKFYTVREDYVFDYRLRDESDAIGCGNPELSPADAAVDMYGNNRMVSGLLDLGAYVYIPEPDDKTETGDGAVESPSAAS